MNTDLVKHIERLLYSSECVVIPGFGGFVANRRAALLHKTTGIISPACKVWAFNPLLKHNDGQLVNDLALHTGMGYNDAFSLISNWVSEAWNKLSETGSIEMGETGTFVKGTEGQLVFQPKTGGPAYLPENYGLFPVSLSFAPAHAENKTAAASVTVTEIAKLVENAEREKKVKAPVTEERARKRGPVWAALSVIVLLAASGFFITKNTFFSNVSQGSLNPMNFDTQVIDKMVEKADQENPGMVIEEEIATDHTIPPSPNEDAAKAASPAPAPVVKPDSLYYTIGGAFIYPNNAERFSRMLGNKGFHPELIREPGYRLVRVSYETYPSREEAVTGLEDIRKVNPEAWLLVLKNPDTIQK